MQNPITADCPDAVRAYMTLSEGDDRPAAVALFTEDAHVTDDGRDYRGVTEIRTWLDEVAGEYTYTATPMAAQNEATDQTSIQIRLEGNFPGGLVDVDYRFRLDSSGRLARLTITPSAGQPETA